MHSTVTSPLPESGVTAAEFEVWVAPHWSSMARLARRMSGTEWEDVLQDALTSAWRKRAQFDSNRGQPLNWLLAIVADRAHKAYRHRRVEIQLADPGAGPDALADVDISRAIGRLTERQRLTVTLYYFLDLPIAEIAQVLRCSEGTIKSTLADARKRLRAALGEEYL